MQKILTPDLLESLIAQGYRYCLSRTTCIVGDDADTCITLTPVKYAPALKRLPLKYDTYFKIGDEPRQMSMGVNETIILVDMHSFDTASI